MCERLVEKLGVRLGENQKRVLALVIRGSFVTIPHMAEALGISTTAVENNLSRPKSKGFLRRVGPGAAGRPLSASRRVR